MAAASGAYVNTAPSPFKQALGPLPGEPKNKDNKKKSSVTAPLLLPLLSGGQKTASITNLQVNFLTFSFLI